MPFIVTTKRPVAPDEDGQPFCAACSHYHAGACLCPDCGRPTPCRDHHVGASTSTPSTETVSRVAVATLEEARDAVNAIVQRPAPPWSTEGLRFARECPESGGTVGPLPDGSLIEVEPTDWYDLNKAAGLSLDDTVGDGVGRYARGDEQKILAAFNEANRVPS